MQEWHSSFMSQLHAITQRLDVISVHFDYELRKIRLAKIRSLCKLKNVVFWHVKPCGFIIRGDMFFRNVDITSQTTAFFTVTAVKTSNLT
jgi:hypothetical protein